MSIVLLLTPVTGFAHPGNTASDGCHYCRTNCAKWGEVEGARHCHGSSIPYTPSSTYTAPSFQKEFNGETYYSESSYNAAVARAEFETNHKQNIKETFQDILHRVPADAEVEEWYNYSRDITEISNALLATDEYKEIVFEKEHQENIRIAYKEMTGKDVSNAIVRSLAERSRDINEIRTLIENEYKNIQSEPQELIDEISESDVSEDESGSTTSAISTILLFNMILAIVELPMLLLAKIIFLFTEKK